MLSSKVALGCSQLAGRPVRANGKPAASRLPRLPTTRAIAEPPTAVPFLSSSDHLEEWSSDSWRKFTALQQPNYPDQVRTPEPKSRRGAAPAQRFIGNGVPQP
jgi:hypothetical protein